MDKLRLGIDLCNDISRISQYVPDNIEPADFTFPQADGRNMIQTAIGRRKGSREWLIGKEAYMCALTGQGIVADKLLSKIKENTPVVIENETFTPLELLSKYISLLINAVAENSKCTEIERIVITIENFETSILDSVMQCMDLCGISREKIHIISHTEAYLYFVLSQQKDMWSNTAVLFDWSSSELHYYELNVIRGISPKEVRVRHKLLESGFSEDGLADEAKQKLADSVITAHAKEMMQGKVINYVILSGNPMRSCEKWGKTFLQAVGSQSLAIQNTGKKRRVFIADNIFAKGAVYAANDDLRETSSYPYTMLCDGRAMISIWLETSLHGSKRTVYLANEGSNWYESRSTVDLILKTQDPLRLKVKKSGDKLIRFENIDLSSFPKRPLGTTRIRLTVTFKSEKNAVIRIQDMGFGEFYPASGKIIRKEIVID